MGMDEHTDRYDFISYARTPLAVWKRVSVGLKLEPKTFTCIVDLNGPLANLSCFILFIVPIWCKTILIFED